ncbi:hypothetical protein RUND412_011643, partial [Rhizina undulata]
ALDGNPKATNPLDIEPRRRTQNPEPRTQNPEPRTQNPETMLQSGWTTVQSKKAKVTEVPTGKREKVTTAERDRRQKNRLCYYCADPGHIAIDYMKAWMAAGFKATLTVEPRTEAPKLIVPIAPWASRTPSIPIPAPKSQTTTISRAPPMQGPTNIEWKKVIAEKDKEIKELKKEILDLTDRQ